MNLLRSNDFPDWMGPMLVKELRQGLKARSFEISFIVLQVVLAAVLGYHALLYARNGPGFDGSGLNGIFWAIIGIQLLALTPLRAVAALANERKANTLELIFMSGLSSWRITWGKWASLQFQSLLFILAVLPYGLLRYFFGSVNITEDLMALGWMVIGSAVISAMAIALSGMPAFARIGAVLFGIFFGVSALSSVIGMFFIRAAGGPSGSMSGPSVGDAWPLLLFNGLLLGLGSLEIGAASIAPVAENHALRQRLLVLAAVLPIPLMKLLGAANLLPGQLGFFGILALIVSFSHLSAWPQALRVHTERFSRRGREGGLLRRVVLSTRLAVRRTVSPPLDHAPDPRNDFRDQRPGHGD